jgi:Molybdopterin cofactor-binding domain
MLAGGTEDKEHAMPQKLDTSPDVIGIDIGKNSFHIVGQNQRGAIVLRQKWSRGQVEARLANLPPCRIGMEARVGAHHLSRTLTALGHDARLMPAKYVRPYSKGQKNDYRDHWRILEASFKPEFLGKEWRKIGDVEAGLKGGTLVEAEYRAPYVAHQPLEPLNGIGVVTDAGMEIWVGHQSPQFVQSIAATAIGLKPEQITFHNQWTGGSFGHRLEYENVRVLAEIANQMRGTPIKLVFSREEDFLQDIPRQIAIARHKGSVEKGKIVAADLQLASTAPLNGLLERSGIPSKEPDAQLASGLWNVYYDIPNFRATTYEGEGAIAVHHVAVGRSIDCRLLPLKSYDASKARSMPGVKRILEVKNGVAVIATNSWYAMKAVEAIDCKWAPSTYPAEQADHRSEDGQYASIKLNPNKGQSDEAFGGRTDPCRWSRSIEGAHRDVRGSDLPQVAGGYSGFALLMG